MKRLSGGRQLVDGSASDIRTVGAYLDLPEPGEVTDDAPLRRDVAALIGSMSTLAAQTGIELAVEYREEEIGWQFCPARYSATTVRVVRSSSVIGRRTRAGTPTATTMGGMS